MRTYYKGGTSSYHSISDNISNTSKEYKYANGYFGEKGKAKVKNEYYRQIDCTNQYSEAKKFYDSISKGGIEEKIPNGKGFITHLKDGTYIVYREITSTVGSPAIEIVIKKSSNSGGIKAQKIHFEKEKK